MIVYLCARVHVVDLHHSVAPLCRVVDLHHSVAPLYHV